MEGQMHVRHAQNHENQPEGERESGEKDDPGKKFHHAHTHRVAGPVEKDKGDPST